MKHLSKKLVAAACIMMITPLSDASTISFDFTSAVAAPSGLLPDNVTVNGVTATGYVTNLATTAPLWKRNQTNDHGLGVCSEGESNCKGGGGDVNELDNMGNSEFITLENTNDGIWTSLWVSSLDSNNSGPTPEAGVIYWGNDLTTIMSGLGNSFSFNFGDFGGNVEGDLLTLSPTGFDASAKYILFANDSNNGNNNDYLVWKGTVDTVPEPATLSLIAIGILALTYAERRRAP